ncbi:MULTISPECIES: hypothetical protein [Halorussus]|uniref:hypothetical protein n=1 Tax=Halorussus TaxID=1070314 RepID=UPI000E21075F|nr:MULTISPECIES: hypothetical protein [Halorussus]NHN60383.1 hypothetical protein [Halorussus sp. JP-T4]
MSIPKSVGDADASILVVASVPAAVAVAVAWLLPLHRTLQSGVAIVVWLALLVPWLDYVKK